MNEKQGTFGMTPIEEMPKEVSKNLIGVLTDIDDTITTDGKLPPTSYFTLSQLANLRYLVIPVTGRPAGWCDMIARFWPVAGVIGENGALAMRYDRDTRKMRKIYLLDEETRKENRRKLDDLGKKIMQEVPGSALASDQPYREADLAIDYCEDVKPLAENDVARIVNLFQAAGATAKVSSIHVNGWFGDWDKLAMTRKFLAQEYDIDLDKQKERFVFCGDSPNDAPLFGFFPNSCGVANVADFAGKMDALPTYIARSRGAQGFVEIGEKIMNGLRV